MEKYHIENNTVQETLIIPLYGRKVCSEYYPNLFNDPEAEKICNKLDYDFETNGKKMKNIFGLFGAIEVAQRQYDICVEIKDYLKKYPNASVVNLGCGLDDTFHKCDNDKCSGYNIDFPDVIDIRNNLLPAKDRETNISSDLTDYSWMDKINKNNGAIFYATGVFYYLKTEDVKNLINELKRQFPDGVVVFDTCNNKGAKMMRKTWLKEANIKNVNAYFSLEDPSEIKAWNSYKNVSSKSYMRGYRDIYNDVNIIHKLLIQMCEHLVKMRIIKIEL